MDKIREFTHLFHFKEICTFMGAQRISRKTTHIVVIYCKCRINRQAERVAVWHEDILTCHANIRPDWGTGGQMSNSVSTHLMFFGAASEAMELYQTEFAEFKIQEIQQYGDADGEMAGKIKVGKFLCL